MVNKKDMKKTYYVNAKQYDNYCLKSAISKALSISKTDEEVKQIIIVVSTKNQFSLLDSVFPEKAITGRCYHVTGSKVGVRFETVKTLSPYSSCTAILVPLCLSQKDLIKYEDEFSFRYWIVVPWFYSELEPWLKVHSAIDVATNKPIEANYSLDEKIQNAIGWLKATLISSNPEKDARDIKNNIALIDDNKFPLRKYFIDKDDNVILKIMLNCFNALDKVFHDESKDANKNVLWKTTGFSAIIRSFPELYRLGELKKDLSESFFISVFTKVRQYMQDNNIALTGEKFGGGGKQVQQNLTQWIVSATQNV